MNLGKQVRLQRIFNRETGRAIIVPMDHGVSVGPIEGIENIIIAENKDVLMICHREHEDNIRHFDDMLKHTKKEL